MSLFRQCPFCMQTHVGDFEEDLDQAIMRCRKRASPERRGDLVSYRGFDTRPIPIEREEIERTKEAEKRDALGHFGGP